MTTTDLNTIEGRRFPAGRKTQPIVGGQSPIQSGYFSMGLATLDGDGGQVPWHRHGQEEVYLVIEGAGEMCLGDERAVLAGGQAVAVPPGMFHQITNTGKTPLRLIYCYGPAGDVAHWRQELDGTLPRAGIDAPPLPAGASPQRV